MENASGISLEQAEQILEKLTSIEDCLLTVISLIIVIFIIVLCHYVYKFFNIFF